MTENNATIILWGGNEYDRSGASVSIDDLIDALTSAKEEGATHVVMSSGNYRGAQWMRVSDSWEWADDES